MENNLKEIKKSFSPDPFLYNLLKTTQASSGAHTSTVFGP